jgi:O-antigen ligase
MKHFLHSVKIPPLNQLAFFSLFGSGAYIILLWSPNILGRYLGYWTIIIIYLLPWLMLWPAYSWQAVTNREHRLEITLIVSIIILGIINIFFGDSVSKSLAAMPTFLLTGIFALWASMFLITDVNRRRIFDWFCCACLAIIVPIELAIRGMQGSQGPEVFQLFILNPIPLGTLIILLSSGPMFLVFQKNPMVKSIGWLVVLLGGLLIFIIYKRGAWLGLAAMLAAWMLYRGHRLRYLAISVLAAAALALVFLGPRLIPRLDPKIPTHFTILHRLELYPFALHIWRNHPLMGIGLRPYDHENYLADYQQHNKNLPDFPQTVATLQTFDNMLVTGLVELGTIMTLFYVGLVIFILVKYCRRLRSLPESSPLDWYRVLVLLGFAVHSLTYDSLLFPPLNWLFHVQVGIMAGYHASGTAPGGVIPPAHNLSEI